MNFQFPTTKEVHLSHVNIRREFHGDEHVPAIDLSLRLEGSNELLDMLDPALRTSLYYNAAATGGQEALPEVLAVLPNLRLPKLNGQKFTWAKGERHKGYAFTLDYGLGDGRSNVDLDDCTVTNWRFEVKEGGTVVLEWVVQYAGERLTSEARGLLTGLTDEPIFIQLIPPATPQITSGKAKPKATPAGEDDDTEDLFDPEGDDDGEGPAEQTPEGALAAAVAAGGDDE